jgi:NAD(P)-dependent dehydrogenase (short-subunit alcohol dehydrogenase family)
MSDTPLKDKVAVVTGAGRGIGRGIALAYAAAGAKVVVSSRSQGSIDDTVEEIRRTGGTAIGTACNVGDRAQVFAMVAAAADALGPPDILVNNAQGFGTAQNPSNVARLQPLEIFDEDDWDHTYRTGLMGTLWGMKAVFPHMKDRGGKIINFGSMWGQVGNAGSAAYNCTKEGIRALTRTAAREWGPHGINVNVINPSVRTDALNELDAERPEIIEQALKTVPLGRFGDPVRDAGGLAIFLASSASDYLTGMTFMLDGGLYMTP